MSLVVGGVQYEYAEDVAKRFDYSIFHIRHLAREGAKKNPDGLKGFKHKGRWAIDLQDAENKLTPEKRALSALNHTTMESLQDDGQPDARAVETPGNIDDDDYSCLEGL
jgi:hypothetical protein